MSDIDIIVNLDKSRIINQAVKEAVKLAIGKACFDVEAKAKSQAPVDTGALKSSIYTSLPRNSNYSSAKSETESANPNTEFLPEVKPDDPYTGVVSVGVEYGAYVEYGGLAPAQPYMTPAAEQVEPEFQEIVTRLVNQAID